MATTVEIDADELDALREQAAESIPWRLEAARLAEALQKLAPKHAAINGADSLWPAYFKQKERAKKQYSPERTG